MIVGFLERQDFIRAVYRKKSWDDYDEEKRLVKMRALCTKVCNNFVNSPHFDNYLTDYNSLTSARSISYARCTAGGYSDSNLHVDNYITYYDYPSRIETISMPNLQAIQDPNQFYNLYTAVI